MPNILIVQLLKCFIDRYLVAHSICPPNIFLDETKIVFFKAKHRFWQFVNRLSWCRELHVQQGKCPLN